MIYVDAALVQPGDMVPGLGRVASVNEVGNGSARRVVIVIDYCFTLTAKGGDCKVPVERDE